MKCSRCNRSITRADLAKDGKKIRRYCKQCAAVDQKQSRAKRKKRGLCIDCGIETPPGKVVCQECITVNTKNLRARRHHRKTQAVKLFGGKCADCNKSYIDEFFDFHHKDPQQKDAQISVMFGSTTWENVLRELEKCVMLCKYCHVLRHKSPKGPIMRT
jgi:hypothetical protein